MIKSNISKKKSLNNELSPSNSPAKTPDKYSAWLRVKVNSFSLNNTPLKRSFSFINNRFNFSGSLISWIKLISERLRWENLFYYYLRA